MAGLATAFAGDFTADYSAPGSDSRQAQNLLVKRLPAQAGDTIAVVIHADVTVHDPAVRADVEVLIDDPYASPAATSGDGQTLVAQARLDVTNPVDMPVADTAAMLAVAEDAQRPGLDVALGGQAVQFAEEGEIGSEGFGLAAAAIILLVTFGTVVAAGLPLMATAGLVISSALTGLMAAAIDVPDWSTALASMMGIALGIDYVLLMVTRFREWRVVGLDPERATVATLDTAGRSVLLAGGTVVVSMLGLFTMGLSFMRGAAAVTIITVIIV